MQVSAGASEVRCQAAVNDKGANVSQRSTLDVLGRIEGRIPQRHSYNSKRTLRPRITIVAESFVLSKYVAKSIRLISLP